MTFDTQIKTALIHPFKKSRRHFECLISGVIRGGLSAAILNDLFTPRRTRSTEETKKGQSQLLYPVPIVLIR